MASNLDRFKQDLDALLDRGNLLYLAMRNDCFPDQFRSQVREEYGEESDAVLKTLPEFLSEYQSWYSEASSLVKQLLPDRLADFAKHYEKPKTRKQITSENYRIEDYLQGLSVTRGWQEEKIVGPDAAIPHLRQQVAILKAAKRRFESSLFDIAQLVQADLFDSELEAAKALAKSKFTRAAGALAGVVLEHHLSQVATNHNVRIRKRNPTISTYNDALKEAEVIEISQWRFIQHLGDIRNNCDHSKHAEPTVDQVDDLITGVSKITKTLY